MSTLFGQLPVSFLAMKEEHKIVSHPASLISTKCGHKVVWGFWVLVAHTQRLR